MGNQLHRVEEHPGWQQSASHAHENDRQESRSYNESIENLGKPIDLDRKFGINLALNLPDKLSTELYLNPVIAFKEVNAPESHRQEVFRVEGADILWVLEFHL